MIEFEDKDKIYKDKFLAFGVRVVKLKKFLNEKNMNIVLRTKSFVLEHL